MADSSHRILIVGFGNVGQGFFELFNRKRSLLGLDNIRIAEIVDTKYGHIENAETLDLSALRKAERSPDPVEVIRNTSCDIVCEFTLTDYETGEPGNSYIRTALSSGKSVITSNKGAIAMHYNELMSLARTNEVSLKFKGTVMSGTPSFNLLDLIPGVKVSRFRGILSGTTNSILNEMSYGKSFSQALKEAHEKPHGDVDPEYDVDGTDSAAKCSIVSRVLGWNHELSGIDTTGIRNLNSDDAKSGIKLIAYADEKTAYVKPVKLKGDDLLRSVSGVTNALEFETDTLGRIYTVGPGTGKFATAQAALTDLLDLVY